MASQLLTTSRKQFGNLSENTRRISETIRTSIRQARSAVRSCRHVYGVASRYMYTVCCVMRSNIYGQVYTLKTCFVFSRVVLVFLKQKTKKTQGFFGFGPKTKKTRGKQKKTKTTSRKPKNQKNKILGLAIFLFFWFSRGFLFFFWLSSSFFGFLSENQINPRLFWFWP